MDFEKAFDSVEWNFIHKCLATFNFGLDLRQWIRVFYTDISSCVLSNGYALKHCHLERGVRQGSPLSGTLFVITIELLAQRIRRSKEIIGIPIDEHSEIKLSQYADDTTLLLSDVQSLSRLFDLLSLFERCSGLNLNQTKSEILWICSMRNRNIIKTLALSKLIFISSVINTPKEFSKEEKQDHIPLYLELQTRQNKKKATLIKQKNSWWLGYEGFFSLR